MYVSMYVCMCIHMYVCVCVCMHVYMCVCMYDQKDSQSHTDPCHYIDMSFLPLSLSPQVTHGSMDDLVHSRPPVQCSPHLDQLHQRLDGDTLREEKDRERTR